MKSNILALIIFCLTVVEINSQTVNIGVCAQVPVNSKFNLSAVSFIIILYL